MTIIEKTRELGEMIQQSEEMKNLKAAEAVQEQDENAKTLLIEYNMKRMNLGRDMQSGKISQEEAIKQNNEAFEELLKKSDTINACFEAQKALDKVVNEINAILTYYITGKAPGGCSGNCSGCSGCSE